ncbi:MAG: hypothetical protein JO307_32590 [Bryobacterales bacterium]|nr:hypothetical protein [Bryobacterales bacterium]
MILAAFETGIAAGDLSDGKSYAKNREERGREYGGAGQPETKLAHGSLPGNAADNRRGRR